MAVTGSGVMGTVEIEIHDTGRIDIYSRDEGDIFGDSDREPNRHGHTVYDANDNSAYVRLQGSKNDVIKNDRNNSPPRDKKKK